MNLKQRNRLISILIIISAGIYTLWENYQGSTGSSEPSRASQTTTQHDTNSVTQSIQKPQKSGNKRQSFYDTVMARDSFGQNTTAGTDYYGLVLSWSPAFCEKQRQRYGDNLPRSMQQQCGTKGQYGWVVHGLWAQNSHAQKVNQHPRFCQGDLPPVDQQLLEHYSSDSPSLSLLQGEWEKHGACIFDHADDYFAKQHQLYRSLQLPPQAMKKRQLLTWMRQHNPQLGNRYIDLSVNEMMICYDEKWQVMNCPH